MKIFYKTTASSTGGRSGTSSLDDGTYSFQMVPPGDSEKGVNPEQLFALGYAACFDSAMELAAKNLKLDSAGAKTSVEVGIGQSAQGGYSLDLDITAYLPGMAREDAHRLIEAAHQTCPYSKATRGNIDVRLRIKTEET